MSIVGPVQSGTLTLEHVNGIWRVDGKAGFFLCNTN